MSHEMGKIMTTYFGRIFQNGLLVDTVVLECDSFEVFISKLDRTAKGQIRTVGEWEKSGSLMIHTYPKGAYTGTDKILYVGNY